MIQIFILDEKDVKFEYRLLLDGGDVLTFNVLLFICGL